MTEKEKKRKITEYTLMLNDYTYERNFTRLSTSNHVWKENLTGWIKSFREMIKLMETVPGFNTYLERMHLKLNTLKEKIDLDDDEFFEEMKLLFEHRINNTKLYKVISFDYDFNAEFQDVILLILEDENKREKLILFTLGHCIAFDDQIHTIVPKEQEYILYKNKYGNKNDISNENIFVTLDFDNLKDIVISNKYFHINMKNECCSLPHMYICKYE